MPVVKSFTPPKISSTKTSTQKNSQDVKSAADILSTKLSQPNQPQKISPAVKSAAEILSTQLSQPNQTQKISPAVKSAAEILFTKFVQPQQNTPPQNLFKANSVTLGTPVQVGGTPKPVTFTPTTFERG